MAISTKMAQIQVTKNPIKMCKNSFWQVVSKIREFCRLKSVITSIASLKKNKRLSNNEKLDFYSFLSIMCLTFFTLGQRTICLEDIKLPFKLFEKLGIYPKFLTIFLTVQKQALRTSITRDNSRHYRAKKHKVKNGSFFFS